jgi:serine protease
MTRSRPLRRRSAPLVVQGLEDRTVPAPLPPGPAYATDHIIVRLKSGSAALAPVPGAHSLGGLGLYTVPVASGETVSHALARYRASPTVLYAEPDYEAHLDATPNDPNFADGTLWGLNNTGQSGGVNDADIDAPEGWDLGHDASNVLVAVIDTGIDYTHPELAANVWTNPGEVAGDGIDNDHNGFVDDVHGYDFINQDSDPMDDYGHGTHVSGTIAARGDDGVGVVGVAWSARLMALKIFNSAGTTTTAAEVEAINYAVANGARVSNNSWGGTHPSQALRDTIAAAGKAGHLFIAAAGNDAVNDDLTPHYPASFDLDNIVSVAALTRTDTLSSFSCFGPLTVDLGAPGSEIYSTYPVSMGSYTTLNGTSMATPHVTGAVALLLAAHPDWTVAHLKEELLASTVPIPALAGKTVTGGRLNLANLIGEPGLPRVVSMNPVGSVDGSLSRIRLQFNRPVDQKSLAAAVKLTRPDGSPLKAKIKAVGLTKREWDVLFPAQKVFGSGGVQVFVGPTVQSASGALDQDGDGIGGEVGQDQFVGEAFVCSGTGGAIADSATTEFPIPVGNNFTVRDVNVQVTATHPYVSDLTLELVAPNNAVFPLFLNSGLNGSGLTGTWFDDQSAVRVGNATAPFAGTFQPAAGLAAINGLPAAGTWKLRVTDVGAGAVGSLLGWRLSLTTDDPHPAPAVTDASFLTVEGAWPQGFQVDFSSPIVASTFSVKDVKVTGPTGKPVKVRAVTPAVGSAATRYFIQTDPMLVHGDYHLTLLPTVADAFGASLDSNGNLVLAEKADAVSRTLTATEDVYRSTKPQDLADGKGTAATDYDPNQIEATIKVKSAATVANVRVGFDITHTYASDLRISLVSPKGTTVQLINRRPWSGGGSGYVRTLMDDAAATSIAFGTSPFRGSFVPENPLSTFDGEPAAGTWKLVIEDGWLGDTGRLLDWALYITPAAAAPALAPVAPVRTPDLPAFGVAAEGIKDESVAPISVPVADTQPVAGPASELTPGASVASVRPATDDQLPAGPRPTELGLGDEG